MDNEPDISVARDVSDQPAWRKVWRSLIVPLNAVALIVLLIWLLQSGRIPGLGNGATGGGSASSNFFSTSGQPLGAAQGDGPGLGKPAPEFALLNVDGDVVRLSDFRGKVVLVNFWATWCTPCRKEFPELVKTDAEADDVVIIGINLQENQDQVREFADEYGADFPILMDPRAEVADAYRLFGLPSSYFIDTQGILREQHFGLLTRAILDEKLQTARAAGVTAASDP